MTGSGGATFQTDPKKLERSCGPKCCVLERSIKSGALQGTTTIAMRPLFITRRKPQKSFCYDYCDMNHVHPYKATHFENQKSILHFIAFVVLLMDSHHNDNISHHITKECTKETAIKEGNKFGSYKYFGTAI